jgi:hypothetical protein
MKRKSAKQTRLRFMYKKMKERNLKRMYKGDPSAIEQPDLPSFEELTKWLNSYISANGLNCFYTRKKMTYEANHPNTISLERFDSDQGYTKNNTIFCCKNFNKLKSNMSVHDCLLVVTRYFEKLCIEELDYMCEFTPGLIPEFFRRHRKINKNIEKFNYKIKGRMSFQTGGFVKPGHKWYWGGE